MSNKIQIERFEKQLEFIREIDKVKSIFRQTPIINKSRKENDAEHSWHLATMMIILSEYAPEKTDIFRATKMVLIHDLVEIDAGDTYLFDAEANVGKETREQEAANRIFSILPEDIGCEIMELWHEFEQCSTNEARFAILMDRFQPFLHNISTDGISWLEHGISKSQVLSRMKSAVKNFPLFWDFLESNVNAAVEKGWLKPD
ncbi:MAG: HD domain-containing protein [Spirochaetales bacterium]|nr:HD domain-containing protein [Spirochaetales bacterium]